MARQAVLLCVAFALACAPASESDDSSIASLGTTSMGETETGDEAPDLGICEQYIDCIEAAAPETLTATKAYYGIGGACWDLETSSDDDCRTECRGQLRAIVESFPEVEECFECVEDADCTTDMPYCHVDESLCNEEPQILSCDFWGIWGSCREFGEGFTHEEKAEWCASDDEWSEMAWMSASPTPCKTEGAWGRCEFIDDGDFLKTGPMRIYYYYDGPDNMWTLAEAEMSCIQTPGTWVPF